MAAINFEEFFDLNSVDKAVELYHVITKQSLSVKDTGINYRVINHWDEKGLIRFGRNSSEGYRKFSFVDFIWIKVVNEFREFGVNLPDIKKVSNDVYEQLPIKEFMKVYADNLSLLKQYNAPADLYKFIQSGEYKAADFSNFEFNYLQILIAEAINTRKPVSLLLFKNGDWFPFIHSKEHVYPEELLYKKDYASHIAVSLTEIIFKHIVEDELADFLYGINIFTHNEIEVIRHVKEGAFKKVNVILKDKKEGQVEINKDKDALEKIMRLIRLKLYSEFVFIDGKGKELRIGKSKTPKK